MHFRRFRYIHICVHFMEHLFPAGGEFHPHRPVFERSSLLGVRETGKAEAGLHVPRKWLRLREEKTLTHNRPVTLGETKPSSSAPLPGSSGQCGLLGASGQSRWGREARREGGPPPWGRRVPSGGKALGKRPGSRSASDSGCPSRSPTNSRGVLQARGAQGPADEPDPSPQPPRLRPAGVSPPLPGPAGLGRRAELPALRGGELRGSPGLGSAPAPLASGPWSGPEPGPGRAGREIGPEP